MITSLDDQTQYMLGVAQSRISNNMDHPHITPDNKLSEGIDSVERHMPAPWLPLVRYDTEFRTHVVISSQKAVAFATDALGNQYLVPAGLALEAAAVATAGGETSADATGTVKYTIEDVKAGIKNAKGVLATVGEAVVKSFFDGADQKVFVSPFCGINNYNVFKHPGGDGVNPSMYNAYNFNPQPNVSYNMDYAFQYAMVKDATEYAKAPLTGISAFIGKKAMAGQFITYDVDSNFVVTAEDFTYGTVPAERIVGQVSKVTKFFDPTSGDKTSNSFNQLDKVVNMSPFETEGGLNEMPGLNTKGMTTKISYANGYGLISFSIQTR